jgi:hypothetical protein
VSEPFWKALVEKVREEREAHLEPAREVIDWRAPRPSVERELLEEIANSLSRAERRVEEAIAAARALQDSPDVAAFEAARAEAMRRKRDLSIHREALRFPRDPDFDRRYPIPPRRKG